MKKSRFAKQRTSHQTSIISHRRTLLVTALLLAAIAKADFVPIPLTSGSFNRDMVVENTAPASVLGGGYTTASMDYGIANTAYSWYEAGFNAAAPGTGLPAAGAIF